MKNVLHNFAKKLHNLHINQSVAPFLMKIVLLFEQ
jgi:hypothetical protein